MTSRVSGAGSGLTTLETACEASQSWAGGARPGFSPWNWEPWGASGVICWPILGSCWGWGCAWAGAPEMTNASVTPTAENSATRHSGRSAPDASPRFLGLFSIIVLLYTVLLFG